MSPTTLVTPIEVGPMTNPPSTAATSATAVAKTTTATRRRDGGFVVTEHYPQRRASLSAALTAAVSSFIKTPKWAPHSEATLSLMATTWPFATALTVEKPGRAATLAVVT